MSKKIIVTLSSLVLLFTFTTLTFASPLEQNARDDRGAERYAREEVGPGVYCDECDGEETRLERDTREERRLEEGANGSERQVANQQGRRSFSNK